jgi:xylose isomerase
VKNMTELLIRHLKDLVNWTIIRHYNSDGVVNDKRMCDHFHVAAI